MENKEKTVNKKQRRLIVGLSIALGLCAASSVALGVAYGMATDDRGRYEVQLENVYQKSMYDFVDSVNNAETNLSKILVSNNSDYQSGIMIDVANNMNLAQQSLSNLPLSDGSVSDSIKFINQVNGYMEITSNKLAKGDELSPDDKKNLAEIKDSLLRIKENVNDLFDTTKDGYSILGNSFDMVGDKNAFTVKFSNLKSEDVDYPTMIYDGPFSDSQTNVNIKGLTGNEVSENEAYNVVLNSFDNLYNVKFLGEINSKIQTYNYKAQTTSKNNLYVQVSKIGGHIITVSGMSGSNMDNVTVDSAEDIAVRFAKDNGVENAECVWKDVLDGSAYFNIAPVEKGIILYPDLVKVKVDLDNGTIIGYDSSTYFTNHTKRMLDGVSVSEDKAKETLPTDFMFEKGRLCLCPLEYSREVLCYEFLGQKNGEIYYFYVNAQNGQEENVLKVIETQDGSKLM